MKRNSINQLGQSAVETHSEPFTFSIGGMTCGSCVRHVENALKRVPGVESVSVDLATKSASVKAISGLKSELLIKTVESLGYDAHLKKDTRQKIQVEPQSGSCCSRPA
jgi:copper chaperone CopZ